MRLLWKTLPRRSAAAAGPLSEQSARDCVPSRPELALWPACLRWWRSDKWDGLYARATAVATAATAACYAESCGSGKVCRSSV